MDTCIQKMGDSTKPITFLMKPQNTKKDCFQKIKNNLEVYQSTFHVSSLSAESYHFILLCLLPFLVHSGCVQEFFINTPTFLWGQISVTSFHLLNIVPCMLPLLDFDEFNFLYYMLGLGSSSPLLASSKSSHASVKSRKFQSLR